MVSIGPHLLRNRVILAPMAGVTDAPFRALAWRFGVGHVVSEMLTSRADLWDSAKSRYRRCTPQEISPRAVQIAGGDPETVAEAARRHWQDGADIIDINFGCPAKKVCRKAAGSALLADESLVGRIVAQTVAAVPIPITVKIRTGYSTSQNNGVRIATIVESAGASAIAVHGRSRACRFVGPVEHETTAAIKRAVRIPVFANGDILSAEDARRVLDITGADGVMIGRAALGAPWLPGQIAGVQSGLTLDEKLATIREHLILGHEFYGETGVRIMRKHIQWYFEKLTELGDENWRRNRIRVFNKLVHADQQLSFLEGFSAELAA